MTESVRIRDIENGKARRRAARQMIGEYHEQQLRLLLERVREGFAKMDAGEGEGPGRPDWGYREQSRSKQQRPSRGVLTSRIAVEPDPSTALRAREAQSTSTA